MLLLSYLNILFPAIRLVWADTHYQGLKAWAKEKLGWTIEVVKHWWTGVHKVWEAYRPAPSNLPPRPSNPRFVPAKGVAPPGAIG